MSRCLALLPLLLACAVAGCSPDGSPAGTAIEDPASVPSTGQVTASPDPRPAPSPATAAPTPLPPPSLTRVLTSSDAVELTRWAKQRDLAAGLRSTALRRLEQVDPAAAEQVALGLTGEGEDALLRANAVAVLARSQSPTARVHLLELEPRYRALASDLEGAR